MSCVGYLTKSFTLIELNMHIFKLKAEKCPWIIVTPCAISCVMVFHTHTHRNECMLVYKFIHSVIYYGNIPYSVVFFGTTNSSSN
jgi:hypothetical protein